MEDIRIGRKASAEFKIVTVIAATITPLVTANPRRIALTIGAVTGNTLFVGPSSFVLANFRGFAHPTEQVTRTYKIEDVGPALFEQWDGFVQAGNMPVAIIDVSLKDET